MLSALLPGPWAWSLDHLAYLPGPRWLTAAAAVPVIAQLAAAPIVGTHFRTLIPLAAHIDPSADTGAPPDRWPEDTRSPNTGRE